MTQRGVDDMTQVTTDRAEPRASGDRTSIFITRPGPFGVPALRPHDGLELWVLPDDYTLRPWSWSELGDAFTAASTPAGTAGRLLPATPGLSFALDWELWGTNIWGYHLANIVLHAGATVAVFALLRRVRVPQWCAVVGAVVFAAIPSNVATVVYVAERTDAMVAIAAICGLLCVHSYQRSRSTGPLIALNGFFVVGLLAKEVAVAMVPMVALYWWYLRIEQHSEAAVERRHRRVCWRTGGTSCVCTGLH